MHLHRWWTRDRQERFWLEITDRVDLGVDLHAPQRRADNEEYYGYSLITEIENGDIVFHYHRPKKAISMWSIASGEVWEDTIVWASHTSGERPYARDGWRAGLSGSTLMDQPLSLEELRSRETHIAQIYRQLELTYGAPLYGPFELSLKRPLRPTQAYITKLPFAVIKLFPELEHVTSAEEGQLLIRETKEPSYRVEHKTISFGSRYRWVDEEKTAVSQREPIEVDPAMLERALLGHAHTQNALAEFLTTLGLEPRSPKTSEPDYDIGWQRNNTVHIAEVKSLTAQNETSQLRLGLGQVLQYRYRLEQLGYKVQAILVTEREPKDRNWVNLCLSLGILLIWPDSFARLGHTMSEE
jgi:hypothetical protein